MKLIIDIDENIFTRLFDNGIPMDFADGIVMEKTIRNGIPLDKIRAEIGELEVYYDNDYFSGNRDAMFKCNDVLEIIDKYTKGNIKND